MKGIWEKLRQKTAVMLVASMMVTSVAPITGLAASYGVNGIYSSDVNYDISDCRATASVAATVIGGNEIELAEGTGSGELVLETEYDITIKALATASDADWSETEAYVEKEILKYLSMKATITNEAEEIGEFVSLDTEKLVTESIVAVKVAIPEENLQPLSGKTYHFNVQFEPELSDGLGDNIVITSLSPYSAKITLRVGTGGGSTPEENKGTVKLNGFHGEEDGNTWIYVGDDPVNLNDYCTTDPAGLAVAFTSSNPAVATVSDAGHLNPVANGLTTIKAQIIEEGYAESTAEMTVQVWTGELMPDLPKAFELHEGEKWQYTFTEPLSKNDLCVLDMNGEIVEEEIVKVRVSNERKTVIVSAGRAGSYQLRLIRHSDQQITYYGYVDFTVKPLQNTVFSIHGFNGETDDANGVTTTWTYSEYGPVNLANYCHTTAEGATITFTSSEEGVATIDGNYLVPAGTGRTTVTATMEAPGYQVLTDTLVVDIWRFEPQNNLPEQITFYEGETWARTFVEPLHKRTKVYVYDEYTEETVGEDAVKVTLTEDRTMITVEAKKAGTYYLYYERHNEERYTTYNEAMHITVLKTGVSLDIPVSQMVVEPGKPVTVEVAYSPENAELEFDYDEEMIHVAYEDGKIIVTGLNPTVEATKVRVRLVEGEKVLVVQWISVFVAEKQLEATNVEEALTEANAKIEEALQNGNRTEIYKIVNEVVEILANSTQSEVSENKEAIDNLEAALSAVATVETEVHGEETEIEASGALLNLLSMGESDGKLVVKPVEDPTNTEGVTLDIKLERGSNGKNITELSVPMQLRVKVSGIDLTKSIRIRHTKENGSTEWIYPVVDGEYLVFWVKSYSTFAISNYTSGGGGHSGGGGGGGSSSGISAAGTVSNDAKKGYVNSLTGIITGSAAGYSRWIQEEAGWKLQYADGTFASGTMVTDENGNTYEQVMWEMINGAWYPFGADGYVKSGLVHDAALGGMFYVDIETGMKTGWQLVDGVWRYFNTVSDGKRGIMMTDTTVDGYYIDAEGIWKE